MRWSNGYVPSTLETWTRGHRPHLEYRDLGLAEATDGAFAAQHIRRVADTHSAPSKNDWHCHELEFQFYYVLQGSTVIENEDGSEYTLVAGSSGCVPPLHWHRNDLLGDYEVIEVTSPATVRTIMASGLALPLKSATRKPVYKLEEEGAYAPATGDWSGFRYRDLGASAVTDGRIRVRLLRAVGPGCDAGWRRDAAPTWLLVLDGFARLEVEGAAPIEVRPLDSLTVSPGARHRLHHYSDGYAVVEMCVSVE